MRLVNSANGRVFNPDFGALDVSIIAVDGLYLREAIPSAHIDAIRGFLSDRVRLLSRYPRQKANSADGAVALEVGEGQAGRVGEMLSEAGFGDIETRTDLAGIERVVIGRL